MPQVAIDKFDGGLSLLNPNIIKDNQFETLTNMFYSNSKRVETRRGIRNFGQPVPQAITFIDECDATTGWSATNDANTLATGTAIRGASSLQWNITASGTSATVTKSTISADISGSKGYVSLWLYVPTGFNTDLTDVKFRLGSDSTNYYEWTFPTLTEDSNNFIVFTFTDATTTGTPVDTTITYARWEATYPAAYGNQTGVKMDAIYAYSALSTKPVTSYFFSQRDDTGLRRAIVWCGTNAFLYHEGTTAINGYWEVIDTALTEFETAEGRTNERTRWSCAVYKNIIYMCNGVDAYRSWNDVTISTYGGQPKVRYLQYLDDGDRIAGGGEDDNPITLYYTDAAPADATTLDSNALVVGGDQLGKINGLKAVGQVFVIGKDRKKYAADVTNESSLPLDPDEGWFSHRSLQVVGRGILHQTRRGIENLQARNALAGASAMESLALSDDLQPLIEAIDEKYLNSSCSWYIEPYKNYYFSFDTSSDGLPDATIVRSALVEAWSQYSYPSIYDYGEYIDEAFVSHFLATRATSGQVLEIEYGFSDIGNPYLCDLKTKAFDFNDPRTWKNFNAVGITGLKSLGEDINVEVYVDGSLLYIGTITDAQILNTDSPANSVGVYPVGTQALSGAATGTSDIPLYKYQVLLGGAQFASGMTLQVRMYSETMSFVWTLDQLQVFYDNNVFDMFPTSNFI